MHRKVKNSKVEQQLLNTHTKKEMSFSSSFELAKIKIIYDAANVFVQSFLSSRALKVKTSDDFFVTNNYNIDCQFSQWTFIILLICLDSLEH